MSENEIDMRRNIVAIRSIYPAELFVQEGKSRLRRIRKMEKIGFQFNFFGEDRRRKSKERIVEIV